MSISNEISKMIEIQNKLFTATKKTNADRIRTMSDEELAEWVAKFTADVLEQNGLGDEYELDSTFVPDMIIWLKQPYKEDIND